MAFCHIILSTCIIRPHRSTAWMQPIVTDEVAWSVCLSVCRSICQSVAIVSIAKTAQPIDVVSGMD